MLKRVIGVFCVILALSFITMPLFASDCKTTGEKAKNFWQRLFNYPANVTKDTTAIVADAGTSTVNTIAREVKTVGKVTSGEFGKTPDLVTEPVKDTANTLAATAKDTIEMPVKAAEESAPEAQTK